VSVSIAAFDGDGLNDLAFIYENGIWLPDLSGIRKTGKN
jgi:hypothetical protein